VPSLHDALPSSTPADARTRCLFIKPNAKQCPRLAVEGGELCVLHGGSTALAAEQVKRHLLALTEASLSAIEEVLSGADPKLLADTAFRLLAIAGYGPSSTLKIEDVPEDLASLTTEQLAARASKTEQRLRQLAAAAHSSSDATSTRH
jgi:hypothetical protein